MVFPKVLLVSLLTLACEFNTVLATTKTPGEILWDGRLPFNFQASALDSYSTSKFGAEYVLGAGQKFSQVVKFPGVVGSLFDLPVLSKALEVTINDNSIFAPGGNPQAGFRRTELMPITNNGTDATVNGVTTLHFSLRPDFARPLNISHQYELVFIETNDYASHVWTIKAGTPFGEKEGAISKKLRLEGSTAGGVAGQTLFEVEWDSPTWHNFAVQVDWVKNKLSAYYSRGYEPLQKVVNNIKNDATGKGQAHIGVLKLPTNSDNPSQNGYQQSNLNEGVIYGGLFVEKNTVTTFPY